MSETLPKPPEVPPPIPNIELLAADLAIVQDLPPAGVEEPKEIDFERRNEIKDEPTPQKNEKPMVPIAQIIQAQNPLAEAVTIPKPEAVIKRYIHKLPIVGATPYADAIAAGFAAALVILAVAAATLL